MNRKILIMDEFPLPLLTKEEKETQRKNTLAKIKKEFKRTRKSYLRMSIIMGQI